MDTALVSAMSNLSINGLRVTSISEAKQAWVLTLSLMKLPMDLITLILDRFVVGVNGILLQPTDTLLSIIPRIIDTDDVPRLTSGDQLSNAWGGIIPRAITDRLYIPERTTIHGRNSWRYYIRHLRPDGAPTGVFRPSWRVQRSHVPDIFDLT